MKMIVMTTESPTPVVMADAGVFETDKPTAVDDDAAEWLLKRNFPKFVGAKNILPLPPQPTKQEAPKEEVADNG
jgi:hypothetical protein